MTLTECVPSMCPQCVPVSLQGVVGVGVAVCPRPVGGHATHHVNVSLSGDQRKGHGHTPTAVTT